MKSRSRHLLKLLAACLCGFAFIDVVNAAPSMTTTTTMIMPSSDDLVTRETTNAPKFLPESRTLPEKDTDSRHAYIDNQYIADEETVDDDEIEHNQPLYDLIQQQMEHVLTATGSGISNYDINNNNNADDNPSNDIKRDGIQGLPNRPVFDNFNEHQSDLYDYSEDDGNDGNDQSSDDVKQQLEEDVEGGYYMPTQRTTTTPQSTTTTTTYRPKTTRRRHIVIRTTKSPYRTTSIEPTTTSTTTQWTTSPTQKPKTHRPPTNTLCPNANGYNNHERRLVFKTISTGSQFVHSPIGDLIIKFTIGYAKPPPVMFLPRSSAPVVNDALKTLSSNLLKQLNLNAYQASMKKVKRVKKSQNPDEIE